MIDFGYYNMDCMEGMKQFPDKYFDLAIVDPPYGDGGVHGATENVSGDVSTGIGTIPRGVARQTDISPRDSERDNVRRVGGTWAEKFEKNHCVGCSPETGIL